jgi:hypothetical protein
MRLNVLRPFSCVLFDECSSLGMVRGDVWRLSSCEYVDATNGGRRSEDGEDERALALS